MSEGERDGFIENDVIGNYNVGTNFLGSVSSRKSRRKSKKSRVKTRHRRKRAKRSHTRRSKSRSHKKSKGRKYPHWLKKYWFKKKR